eukprot:evm.model.scf_523.2 EVM.evm.TU.scf_523.2   scf_523:27489-30148(+)
MLLLLGSCMAPGASQRGGLNCSDPSVAPWLTICQADLPPSQRWIYGDAGEFLEINGHRMHYVDIGGQGHPVPAPVFVLLHGQPTWGYLWRNVAKRLAGCNASDFPQFDDPCDGPDQPGIARVVIPDYVGFGRSDKPPIDFDGSGATAFDYSISSHVDQLEGLLDALGLGAQNGGPELVLVAHDWGGGIGAGYLGRRPDNVAGFVCLECVMFDLPLEVWREGALGGVGEAFPGCCGFFDQLRTVQAWKYVFERHWFLEIFENWIVRGLSDAERRFYSFPFVRPRDRWGSFHFPQQLVVGEATFPNGTTMSQTDPAPPSLESLPAGMVVPSPSGVWLEMQRGRNALFRRPVPKLFLTAENGIIFPPGSPFLAAFVDAASAFPDSLTGPINVGLAGHYAQEDQPENISRAIMEWHDATFT